MYRLYSMLIFYNLLHAMYCFYYIWVDIKIFYMKRKNIKNFSTLSKVDELTKDKQNQIKGGVLWPIVIMPPVEPISSVDQIAVTKKK